MEITMDNVTDTYLDMMAEDPRPTESQAAYAKAAEKLSPLDRYNSAMRQQSHNALVNKEFSNMFASHDSDLWNFSSYYNGASTEEIKAKYEARREQLEAIKNAAATRELGTAVPDMPDLSAQAISDESGFEFDYAENAWTFRTSVDEDSFYDDALEEAAAGSATSFGQLAKSQRRIANRSLVVADVNVGGFLEGLAGVDGATVNYINYIRDLDLEDTGNAFTDVVNQALVMMGDVKRIIAGVDGKRLGFGFAQDKGIMAALTEEDPLWRQQMDEIDSNFDVEAGIEPGEASELNLNLKGLVATYGEEQMRSLIQNSPNVHSFRYSLNRIRSQNRMNEYTRRTELGLGVQAGLVLDSFTTDPATAIDLGLGLGLAAAGVALSALGAPPVGLAVAGVGKGIAAARIGKILHKGAKAVGLARRMGQTTAATQRLSAATSAGFDAQGIIEKAGQLIVQVRRVLPSQVLSETVFPLIQYGRLGKKAQSTVGGGTSFAQRRIKGAFKFVTEDMYFQQQTLLGRSIDRFWKNGLENGVQSYLDWHAMRAQEVALTRAMLGDELALEFQSEYSGLGTMMGAGFALGGSMGAGLGGLFEGVGKSMARIKNLDIKAKEEVESARSRSQDPGFMDRRNAEYNAYKTLRAKQRIIKGLPANAEVDELELDAKLTAYLNDARMNGLDLEYGIERAVKVMARKDGPIDAGALLDKARSIAGRRNRAMSRAGFDPAAANYGAMEQYLEELGIGLREEDLRRIDSIPEEDTAPGAANRSMGASDEQAGEIGEDLRARAQAAQERLDSAKARVEQAEADVEAAGEIRTEAGRPERKDAKGLVREMSEEQKAARKEMAEAEAESASVKNEIAEVQSRAAVRQIAGNEDLFIARLRRVGRADIIRRLATEEAEGADPQMGFRAVNLLNQPEDETISNAALAELFMPHELDRIVIDGTTLRDLLDPEGRTSVAEARRIINEAREEALRNVELDMFTSRNRDLEAMGRALGDDDEAVRTLTRMELEEKLADQGNTMESETIRSGLSPEGLEKLTQYVKEKADGDLPVKRSELKSLIDESKTEIIEQDLNIRRAHDAELRTLHEDKANGEDVDDLIAIREADLKKASQANYKALREDLVDQLTELRDIRTMDGQAHVGPMIGILNRLRYMATTGEVNKVDEDGTIRFRFTEKTVASAMPRPYRFMINSVLAGARDADGIFDLHKMEDAILRRLASVDKDMALLIRGDAKGRAHHLRVADGLDSAETMEFHMKRLDEAQAKAARDQYARTGRYAGDLDEVEWNSKFYAALTQVLRGAGTNAHLRSLAEDYGIEITPELEANPVRLAELIYQKEGMESFSQFGGGSDALAYFEPEFVAYSIGESLTTRNRPEGAVELEGRYSLAQKEDGTTTRNVRDSVRSDVAARQGADPNSPYAKRLGRMSPVMTRRLFENARTNKRIQYLLYNKDGTMRSEEDLETIVDWLEGIAEKPEILEDVDAHGQSSGARAFRIAPTEFISRATDKVPNSVQGWIKAIEDAFDDAPPAMISTIHDAIDVAIPGMFGATADGLAGARGTFGLAYGFRTMMARRGSLTDSMNFAYELTMGIDGFMEKARANWAGKIAPVLREKGLIDTDEFSPEEVLGAVLVGLDQPATRDEIAALFDLDTTYMDADASGASILLSHISIDEITDFVGGKQELEALLNERGISDDEDLYTLTKAEVAKTLRGNGVRNLVASIRQKDNVTDAEADQWGSALALWSDILENGDAQVQSALRSVFKYPVMIDLYGAGVDKMQETIFESLTKLVNDGTGNIQSILDRHVASASATGDSLNRGVLQGKNEIRDLATKLAHLLHDKRDYVEGSIIKKVVFGGAIRDKKELGKRLIDLRRQQFNNLKSIDAETLVNNPTQIKKMATNMAKLNGIPEEQLTPEDRNKIAIQTMILMRALKESSNAEVRRNGGKLTRRLETAHKRIQKRVDAATKGLEGDAAKAAARQAVDDSRAGMTMKAMAMNSLANQNFHLDETAAKRLMSLLLDGADEQTVDALFGHMDPSARHAMLNQFFRSLSTSREGRMFVNHWLDMIGDKSLRNVSSDSPIGISRFWNKSGGGMTKEQIRRAAIMQLAVNAAELTGDLPQLKGDPHVEMDMDSFYSEWHTLDALHADAMKRTSDAVEGSYDEALARFVETNTGISRTDERFGDALDEARGHFEKLRKNTFAGRTDENAYGAEDSVTRGGPWGLLDPRLNYHSRDAVGLSMANRVQNRLEFRDLRELEAIESRVDIETGKSRMFSDEEMSSTYDEILHTVPYTPLQKLDNALSMAMDLGTGAGEASLALRSAVMEATLREFARNSGDADIAKLVEAGKWDELYVLFRETEAFEEEYDFLSAKSEFERADIANYGRRLYDDDADQRSALRGQAYRYRARIRGRRHVTRDSQWAHDLSYQTNSILQLEHNQATHTIYTGAETWQDIFFGEAMGLGLEPGQRGSATGRNMAWLFAPADSPGRLIIHDGEVRYRTNYESSRLPLFAQINDSQFLAVTTLTEVYRWKMAHDALGLASDGETKRQVRTAYEAALHGAEAKNMDKFYPEVQRLFNDENRASTIDTIHAAMDSADESMADLSFVGDLGSTGEGRVLFNEALTEADKETIMADLRRVGRTWSDFEENLFTTVADVKGQQVPRAFINNFGEVISAHEVVGQARVHLTAEERTAALNLTRNRPLIERIRTGAALGAERIAFEAEASSRMLRNMQGGIDGSIRQARRKAAERADTIQYLMESDRKGRKAHVVTDLTTGRQFLNFDVIETGTDVVAKARKLAARNRLYAARPEVPGEAADLHADFMDRLETDEDLQYAALMIETPEPSLEYISGVLEIEDPTFTKASLRDKVARVKAAHDDLNVYLNLREMDSPAYAEASGEVTRHGYAYSNTVQMTGRQAAVEAILDAADSDELADSTVDQLIAKAFAKGGRDVHTTKPVDGDDLTEHNRLLRLESKGGAYAMLDTVFQTLEADGAITRDDRILLDAVFFDMHENQIKNIFASADIRAANMATPGKHTALLDAGNVVHRIRVAQDLHKKVNGEGAEFGAVGVILEEIGHMVDIEMRATQPEVYGRTVRDFLNSRMGMHMDDTFRAIFKEVDPTTTISEAFARSFAAIMLNKGAKALLRNAGVSGPARAFFSAAKLEALSKLESLDQMAFMRDLKQQGLARQIKELTMRERPADRSATLNQMFKDGVIRNNHIETLPPDEFAGSPDYDPGYTRRAAAFRTEDGRLDVTMLRRSGLTKEVQDRMIFEHVQKDLEVLGGGAEIQWLGTERVAKSLLRTPLLSVRSRAARHTAESLKSLGTVRNLFLDAAYGKMGQMPVSMRALAALISPTSSMTMGKFSTFNGQSAPTIMAMGVTLHGRWDAPLEELLLMRSAPDGEQRVAVIYDSLVMGSKAPMKEYFGDNQADLLIAESVYDSFRDIMKLTARDMREAGMLKDEASADAWASTMPIRLKPEAFEGDGRIKAVGTLAASIKESMRRSDVLDGRVLSLMVDSEGRKIWPYVGDEAMPPEWRDTLDSQGMGELAQVMSQIEREIAARGQIPTPASMSAEFNAKAMRGELRKSHLGHSFREEYDAVLDRPIADEDKSIAEHMVTGMRFTDLDYSKGFAGIRAVTTLDRIGKSAYVMMSDPFLDIHTLRNDPMMAELVETDMIKVIEGVRSGPGAHALDRVMFGRAFGLKGMGLEDMLESIRGVVEEPSYRKLLHVDKQTGNVEGSAKTMDSSTKNFASDVLKNMVRLIRMTKGTQRYEDTRNDGGLNLLNDISGFATTIMVASRYMLGSVVEEAAHSKIKGAYSDLFVAVRTAVANEFAEGKTRAEVRESLRGISTFVRDLQYDMSLSSRFSGQVVSDEYAKEMLESQVTSLQRVTAGLQKIGGLGFQSMTQRIKAHDIHKAVGRMHSMMRPNAKGQSQYGGLVRLRSYRLEDLKSEKQVANAMRELGVDPFYAPAFIEAISTGIFDQRLEADVRALFRDYSNGSIIDFDRALRDTLGMSEEAARVRTDAIIATKAFLKLESERNAKNPSLEMTQTEQGSAIQLLTRLSSYVGTVSGHLSRAARAGAIPGIAHFGAYAISGYLYYKATQMARGKSFQEAVREGWEQDPHMEFMDMMMGVPLFGWAQMPMSWLFEQGFLRSILGMEEAGSVQGGQTLSLASFSAVNRLLKNLTTIHSIDSNEDLLERLTMTGLPFTWLVGLSSAITTDALQRAGEKQRDPGRLVSADPDARLAAMLKQVVTDPEVSFELPELGTQGLTIPEDRGSAFRRDSIQMQQRMRQSAAAQAVAPEAAAPAPVADPSPTGDTTGPLSAPSSLKAPDSLR